LCFNSKFREVIESGLGSKLHGNNELIILDSFIQILHMGAYEPGKKRYIKKNKQLVPAQKMLSQRVELSYYRK